MTPEKVNIRGIFFDNVTLEEAVEKAALFFRKNTVSAVFTPNAEIAQFAAENPEFKKCINSAELILPDGQGILLAARFNKKRLKQKVPGVDFMDSMLRYMASCGLRLYIFGGTEEACKAAAENIVKNYPGIIVCGRQNGYFDPRENEAIIEDINQKNADFLMVCLGSPKQEMWIYENKDKLNIKIAAALGGTIDIQAGTAKRAPKIFIKLGLEWFWRLLKNPSRFGRMLKIPKYLLGAIFSKE